MDVLYIANSIMSEDPIYATVDYEATKRKFKKSIYCRDPIYAPVDYEAATRNN